MVRHSMKQMNISKNLEIRSDIEAQIDLLAKDYAHHKALILTERDLQCELQSRLSRLPSLAGYYPTADQGVTGTRVHAELPWFDKHNKLSIRPDLSILEVDQLSIIHGIRGGRLPSKEFSFGGNAIILETKFCRPRRGITDGFFEKEIRKDIEKIDALLARLEAEGFRDTLYCYFVIFSKSANMCAVFQELQNGLMRPQYKLIYKTAGMAFPSRQTGPMPAINRER